MADIDESEKEISKGVVDPGRKLVVKSGKVPDGNHTGTIIRIEYRDEPYAYADLFLSVDGYEGVELKVGYPQNVSSGTTLGRLLENFGEKLGEGNEVILDNILLNKKVRFLTNLEKTTVKDKVTGKMKPAEFPRVVKESVKPL